jgi:hypothetical protein
VRKQSFCLSLKLALQYSIERENGMLTIRGVYDGKTIRPLPGEPLPEVEGEVEVRIIFCEPVPPSNASPAELLFRIRDSHPPLPHPVSKLIEYERSR